LNIDLLLILLIVGLLQGILEWLPVSSEAFLFLTLVLLGVSPDKALAIAVMYHLPTGLASIYYYKREYIGAIKEIMTFRIRNKTMFIIITTIFTAIVAVPLYFIFEKILIGFESIIGKISTIAFFLVGLAMLITGAVVKVSERGHKELNSCTISDCVIIGSLQGFSILPGVSRSGVTIASLLYRGFDKEDSINGSFIMAGIVSVGVFLFLCIIGKVDWQILCSIELFISMLVTFVVSLIMMRTLITIARRMKYDMFLKFIGSLMIVLAICSFFI